MKTVSVSSQTLDLLKNFSSINSNVLIRPDGSLSTIAENKTLFAAATIEEKFPGKFGIYDLNNFLSVYSSFDNPMLEFSEETGPDGNSKFIVIKEQDKSAKFKYYGAPENVLTFMTQDFKMPNTLAEFTISKNVLNRIIKAVQVGMLPHLILESLDGKTIDVVVTDVTPGNNNKSVNEFRIPNIEVNKSKLKFQVIINAESLRMIAGDYKVSVAEKVAVGFKNEERGVEYFIAFEKQSRVGFE